MAAKNFEQAVALVLALEGGYVDHTRDPGGATNRGITRSTLASWRGRSVSKAEVKALGTTEAAAIYRARYWDAVRGDELPASLDLALFDLAVHSGPARAARLLCRALDLPEAGRITAQLLAAAHAEPATELLARLAHQRARFLGSLTTWAVFGRGWRRRLGRVEQAALALAGAPAGTSPLPSDERTYSMIETKSLLLSKTLWANAIGLAALLADSFGLDVSDVDAQGFAEALTQAIAGIAFVASTLFRLTARKALLAG